MTLSDDGEFCVALRGGLLPAYTAHLYAGCCSSRLDPAC